MTFSKSVIAEAAIDNGHGEDFEFSSKVIEISLGPVFSKIANSLMDAFIKRAKKVYG